MFRKWYKKYIIGEIRLVRINSMAGFVTGLSFAFFNVYIIVLGYSISFFNIYFLLTGAYLIFNNTLKHKKVLLNILFSFSILISIFIFITTRNVPLLSKETLLGTFTVIFFLILGIMTHFGYLSEE